MALGKRNKRSRSPTPTLNASASPPLSQIRPWKKWRGQASSSLEASEASEVENDEEMEDVEASAKEEESERSRDQIRRSKDDHQGPSESQTFIARLLQRYSPSTTLQAAWREASDGLQSASASKQTRKSSQRILSLSKVYSEEGKQRSTGTGRKRKEKGKGKKKAEVTQVQRVKSSRIKSSSYLKVREVVFLPDGVIENSVTVPNIPCSSKTILRSLPTEYLLPDPKLKLSADLVQLMVSHKLAVVAPEEGISFLKDAEFDDIQKQLQGLFPEVFAYFDTLEDIYNNDLLSEQVFIPHWMVCTKSGRQLSIASGVTYPTGHVLDLNSNTVRSGFKERQLVLTTRKPIPREVINGWKTKKQVAVHFPPSPPSPPSVEPFKPFEHGSSPLASGRRESPILVGTDSEDDGDLDHSGTYQGTSRPRDRANTGSPRQRLTRSATLAENDVDEISQISQTLSSSFSFGPDISQLDNPWSGNQELGF